MTDEEFQKLALLRKKAADNQRMCSDAFVWIRDQLSECDKTFDEIDERYRAEKAAREETL